MQGREFVISGTQTGSVAQTGGQHYARVTDYDIDANRVSSTGPVEASSESLTGVNTQTAPLNRSASARSRAARGSVGGGSGKWYSCKYRP